MNLGDEAILHAMLDQLRQWGPVDVTVFSQDPDDTRRRHQVERAIPPRELSREEIREEISGLDLLVLGGGGILFDGHVETFLREAQIAHELDVPVMVYAIGAGPLATPGARSMVRTCLDRAAVLTVRDRHARHLLEDIGLSRPAEVTADPAMLLAPEPLPPDFHLHEGLDLDRRLVGISVREPGPAAPDMDVRHYHQLLANAADFMVDRLDATVVFVPMERQRLDLQHSHAVISQMEWPQRATVLHGEYRSGQILTLMSHFAFALGMRLHFLIFAALAGVPFVALPYASKVEGFLAEMEMAMPALAGIGTGRLLAYVDRSWDQRALIHEHLRRQVPVLQARARRTHQQLVELLASCAAKGDTRPAAPGPP
jgi:polysaccharide pyruvyl transferase CsaB